MKVTVAVLSCGNCGADVPITSPGTVTVTCSHCGSLCLRRDVDLEAIGQVALPTPLLSRFELGSEGRFENRPFVVRGQIQLDHDTGLWNEWVAEADEGWLWIAEAQGELHVYEEVTGVRAPGRENLPDADPDSGAFIPPRGNERWAAGDRVDLGPGDDWTIREIGRGTVVTFRGELPVRMKPGDRTTYVDLVRGAGEVATLDFTRPGDAEVLLGRFVGTDELHLDPGTAPDYEPARIRSEEVRCPNCGGTIEVQDAERAISLGCQHCGSLLQRENQAAAYAAVRGEERMKARPSIPIGAVGDMGGEELTVLGFLERSVTSDGIRYPWREYLTRSAEGRYRWLIESDGHWTLAHPVPATKLRKGKKVDVGGGRTRSFSSGEAVVDEVLGEFYWKVRVGERVHTRDFVDTALGRMASFESSPLEASASLARHVEPGEVEDAFPTAKLPRRVGVGPVQPNPHSPRSTWKVFALLFVLLTGSCVATRVGAANEVVHQSSFDAVASAPDTEEVDFSEPFEIRADGKNVRITLRAPTLDGGYLAFLGALINEDTGEVRDFQSAAQYYSGVSGGERWSEGNRRGRVLIGPIPSGRYRLRIATRPYDRAVSVPYQVEVKSDVPRSLWFVLALIALLPFPFIVAARAGAFEARRWANSD
ncbi:MAG: DUF4178 domain-containing protein [Planctomycetota bacterium]